MKKPPNTTRRDLAERALSQSDQVHIRQLSTGVAGLNEILGGGIPEFSCNIIAGAPGCGKTTLAHQIMLANATEQHPAIYFTVLGEPATKILRYQQQFAFFRNTKVGTAIQYVNLHHIALEQDLSAIFEEIVKRVTKVNPGVVVVDSFRSMMRQASLLGDDVNVHAFIQRVVLFLSGWHTTTFLVGEYHQSEISSNTVFTLVDGIIWLDQVTERNSVVRKLQIIKARGQASVPGLHTFRIHANGLQAYSRTLGLQSKTLHPGTRRRLSIGIPELDQMLGGGILECDNLLVAGPSGTGKSVLATHFIAAGIHNGEPGIIATFEERPEIYTARCDSLGFALSQAQNQGLLKIIYLRPLDLSVDEAMHEILDTINQIGAKRLAIDSLIGFEMALAPDFREYFRESLYRMIGALARVGVTILSTVEVDDTFTSFPLSHYSISFLTDEIIRMRYVEIDGQLRKVLVVIKMRGGNHSKDIREYIITDKGMVILQPRHTDYYGLITGIPKQTGPRMAQQDEAAPEPRTSESQ